MPIDKDTRRRFRFFLEYAGYSTPPGRAVCALSLARAEQWLDEQDEIEYSIEPDYNCNLSWMDERERSREHECVGVYLRTKAGAEGGDGYLPYSVWGVVDADHTYLRVLVAELVSEMLSDRNKVLECWRY